LIKAIAASDRRKRSIADTHRHVGALAAEIGLTRPSYEQVRTIVHLLRTDPRDSRAAEIIIGVALGTRPAQAMSDLWNQPRRF
jgi:hypothetical protein